ncbi:aminotransferase class I/II-fold pyridoxal phosphate-dependent enzyme [Mycolicibacterium sp.]|uniref:aminotransferase class I/II-fold pyridoxal phosphate-dependent enzyme n=1 Tax=Mycolicibacterium sp. TaxID=2320850 RepID=UPI003D12BF0C
MAAPARFRHLDSSHAPGQQRAGARARAGDRPVDFSHGDVGAFPPHPAAAEAVHDAIAVGATWAYSPYRGHREVRSRVADRLGELMGLAIDPDRHLLVSAGTQAGLYLAMSSVIERGDRVGIVAPDYFAYRKITEFLEAQPVDVTLHYREHGRAGEIDLESLTSALDSGVRTIVFSNPNNPTGVVYEPSHLLRINATLAEYGAFAIVDQLYARQIFDGRAYTHFAGLDGAADRTLTLIGPSKTESLSGFRLGVTIGPEPIISRMETVQGLVTLRAPGYSQAVLTTWLAEPPGWLDDRVAAHQRIRDELMAVIQASDAVMARPTEGGSYLFIHIPAVAGDLDAFVESLRVEDGVTVTRGTEFGSFPDAVRLNFSQDRTAAVAALRRLVDRAQRW